MSYHGKIIQLLVGLLEGLYVVGRQHWIIRQIGGDDILYPGPAISKSPGPLEVPAASSEGGCWAPAS
jgi:hypothetical protein